MIAVLSRSRFLADEISLNIAGRKVLSCLSAISEDSTAESLSWLRGTLSSSNVFAVFYESLYFVDPAPLKSLSPSTHFIFISSPGEEDLVEKALSCGASAFVQKPFSCPDIPGVLDLVSH